MALRRVDWRRAHRIIAARHPPIDLFERATPDPAVWEALIALEQLTNPRVRDASGVIALVPAEDRISGPGASWVMAAFTHLNPRGSRFSDGSYGVYYAADRLETAIAETAHHFEAFARDSADPPRTEAMRVLVGTVAADLVDVAGEPDAPALLDPDSYARSQPWGAGQRRDGADGLVFPSVRDAGGLCVGAFRPRIVGPPTPERVIHYRWNGSRIDRWFDPVSDAWIAR
jgi:hypothetical protein